MIKISLHSFKTILLHYRFFIAIVTIFQLSAQDVFFAVEQKKIANSQQDQKKQLSQENIFIKSEDMLVVEIPYRKSRMRKRSRAPKQETVRFKDKSYEQLEVDKKNYLAQNNKDIAIKCLELMLKISTDVKKIAVNFIELADLYFDTGLFEKAGNIYTQFVNLYPGNEQIEYSQYRSVLCSFYEILDSEHDQTKTEETIELANNFLERADIFIQYAGDVDTIRSHCYEKLITHELNVCNFYINCGNYASAQKRIDGLRSDWLHKKPTVESNIVSCEIALAQQTGNITVLAQKKIEYEKLTTEKDVILVASNKEHMTDRF